VEGPVELLLGFARRRDVDGEQELLEVDLAAVIRVECAEDVFAELLRVALWEETGIDFEELFARQLTLGTVSL
jgi:hypothetical protein